MKTILILLSLIFCLCRYAVSGLPSCEKTWAIKHPIKKPPLMITAKIFLKLNLAGEDLREMDLQREALRGMNLRVANLWKADLRNAKLQDTDMLGVTLIRANLKKANFSRAILRSADFREAIFQDTILRGADLRNADLRETNLQEVDLFGANLQGTKVTKEQAEYLTAQGFSGFVVRDVIKQEPLSIEQEALQLESQPKERRFL